MLPSPAPPPGWVGGFCPDVVKPGRNKSFQSLYGEHPSVLGVVNLRSLLDRLWVSCHQCSVVLGARLRLLLHGFASQQACLVFVVKPAFLSHH